ncbi:MAG: hypothetical protein IJI37_06530 [Opitutales bacterium]|nr:hypothetical protein [Opitutales bacterium]
MRERKIRAKRLFNKIRPIIFVERAVPARYSSPKQKEAKNENTGDYHHRRLRGLHGVRGRIL